MITYFFAIKSHLKRIITGGGGCKKLWETGLKKNYWVTLPTNNICQISRRSAVALTRDYVLDERVQSA